MTDLICLYGVHGSGIDLNRVFRFPLIHPRGVDSVRYGVGKEGRTPVFITARNTLIIGHRIICKS